MPALDIYHDAVKNALSKDGCVITHDFNSLFEEPIGKLLVESENLRILVFKATNEVIVRWIP